MLRAVGFVHVHRAVHLGGWGGWGGWAGESSNEIDVSKMAPKWFQTVTKLERRTETIWGGPNKSLCQPLHALYETTKQCALASSFCATPKSSNL